MDSNLFYSTLFNQLNKIDNINIIEYFIKNKIIPTSEKLGLYYLIRTKGIKDFEKYKEFYNIVIDILVNENIYDDNIIKQIAGELIDNKDFSESFELICDNYFQEFHPMNKIQK